MASSGQVIENPRRKARMTFLRTAEDTEGELLAMLAEEEPTLARPPLHRHPHQEERFEVRSGTLDYQLGEQVYTAGPGEVAVVPPGVPHSCTSTLLAYWLKLLETRERPTKAGRTRATRVR